MNHLKLKQTSHGLHLLATLLTGGLWIIVWVVCTLSNNGHNRTVLLARALTNTPEPSNEWDAYWKSPEGIAKLNGRSRNPLWGNLIIAAVSIPVVIVVIMAFAKLVTGVAG